MSASGSEAGSRIATKRWGLTFEVSICTAGCARRDLARAVCSQYSRQL